MWCVSLWEVKVERRVFSGGMRWQQEAERERENEADESRKTAGLGIGCLG